MKKGDVWSLKVKDCEGLHPLVIISEIKDAETIEVIPLFSGDENATHRDRLIYPYLYWLLGDDWAAVSLKKEIHVSNLRVYLNTLPEITLKELEKALKKEKCNLPKGVLMIEGLGDEREKFRKELTKNLSLMDAAPIPAGFPDVFTVTIKWIKGQIKLLSDFAEVIDLNTPMPSFRNTEDQKTNTVSFRFSNTEISFVLSTVFDSENKYFDIIISEASADRITVVFPDSRSNEMVKLSNEKWILSGLDSLKPHEHYFIEFHKNGKVVKVKIFLDIKGV